ncbi:hypothetical protein EGW08_014142 [Elysia chlorotica]|uniref:Uncharacterized protein n=1 Tax=Elysia chlorotica TaxID=188477 RepID=A0A3S1B7U9_ELYCH|nr:hypothetical protein EGW08_014142 [Elysia chlorotica]
MFQVNCFTGMSDHFLFSMSFTSSKNVVFWFTSKFTTNVNRTLLIMASTSRLTCDLCPTTHSKNTIRNTLCSGGKNNAMINAYILSWKKNRSLQTFLYTKYCNLQAIAFIKITFNIMRSVMHNYVLCRMFNANVTCHGRPALSFKVKSVEFYTNRFDNRCC